MIDPLQIPSAFRGVIGDMFAASEAQVELKWLCEERTRLTEQFQEDEDRLLHMATSRDLDVEFWTVTARMNRTAARLEQVKGLIQQASRSSEALSAEVEE